MEKACRVGLMRIIIDANILFAALIKESTTRKIFFHPMFEFFAPDFIFDEINKNLKTVMEKTGMSEREIQTMLDLLKDNIFTFSFSFYKKNLREAKRIIGGYDKKDIPYIALALSMGIEGIEGIWTNDRHFLKQKNIRVWKTKELLDLLK